MTTTATALTAASQPGTGATAVCCVLSAARRRVRERVRGEHLEEVWG